MFDTKRWYIVQTYSGYENSVKKDLERRIDSMGMNDFIFQIIVPEETIIERKADGTDKEKIKQMYKQKRECMVQMIEKYFPKEIKSTQPEGGMFLWVTLPDGISSLDLFNLAAKENVAFVPGDPFYVKGENMNTLRLNYTNSTEEMIEEGIKRLAKVIKQMLA